jgi:hypothetical protein
MGTGSVGPSASRLLVMDNLIVDSIQKVLMILGDLEVSVAKDITKWLSTQPDKIKVLYLVPYSPEINHGEYFNRDLKTMLNLS